MSASAPWIIGLMSGTSMDGVDAALVRTDGDTVAELGPAQTLPYDDAMRGAIRACLGGRGNTAALARRLAEIHAAAVRALLVTAGMAADAVSLLGFHGHTLLHRPAEGRTWQVGDGALLARLTGIPVLGDFRSQDVAMGGQGAPLVPLYHAALARRAELAPPLLVLNLGGVGNVTWIGADGALLAFDTGPGNALIDDWMRQHTGAAHDEGGRLAAQGRCDEAALAELLAHPYFGARPPKSLDRDDFSAARLTHLDAADGAATLTAFTAAAVARGLAHLPERPARCLVCGGGRHNAALMTELARRLNMAVEPVEALGWRGDFLEAEAFAYLAARAAKGLPLSLPGTTGVRVPVSGGRLYRP